jgi:hypothetical protein
MVDYSDAVVIVAALIQSGQFKLVDSNRAERQALADVIDANDWRMVPALVALRKLTEQIHRALSEAIQPVRRRRADRHTEWANFAGHAGFDV